MKHIKSPVCNLLYKNPEVRIAGFCGLLEAAFDMVPIYIDQFVSFDNGEVNDWFFERCSKIAENMYGPVLRKDERFVISTEICKRSQKVNVQNLAQYLSLMKISDEDKKKWMYSCGKNIRSCIEFSTIDGNELPETTDISSKPELALSRKQENMLKKTNHYMASILLHPSLVFLKSGLYINSSLKKASSLLESSFLNPLVDEGYIVAIRNGLICKKSKVTVYIKTLPSDDNASKEDFAARLAFLNDVRLNFDTYMASCNTISLHTMGILNEEVMHVLQLERYEQLNIDFNSFFRRIDNGNDGPTYEINCTVLAKENELIKNLMVSQIEDNSSSVNDESSNNSEHQKTNSIRSLDILSENDGADDSRCSGNRLVVIHEEIIEPQAVMDDTEPNHVKKRSRANYSSEIKTPLTKRLNTDQSFLNDVLSLDMISISYDSKDKNVLSEVNDTSELSFEEANKTTTITKSTFINTSVTSEQSTSIDIEHKTSNSQSIPTINCHKSSCIWPKGISDQVDFIEFVISDEEMNAYWETIKDFF
ncbi:unnamed protein product [Adineta steineri]|uniref:Uncharacterized protein n=1 Tax=Adineta steineri TaxID=433720 RepID=A0A814WJU6_9BILA|nr:unnamed protein product [Adineta steineri]